MNVDNTINPFPRNPATVLIIQDKLLALPGDDLFSHSLRLAAGTDLNGCLKMILDQAKDNREAVMSVIGVKLLIEIEQWNS